MVIDEGGDSHGAGVRGPSGDRERMVRRGLYLCVGSVVWNIFEGVVAVASGLVAGSVALVGFGMDSFIETASAAVVGWRFSYEMGGRGREKSELAERRATRFAGFLLLMLALYILFDAGRRLVSLGPEPEPSKIGIILTVVSLGTMPLLGRAKLKVAARLGSRALRADAYETITCAWLSATTLAGLLLNAGFGWWWADPLAALVLVPLIVREGLEGLRGECCGNESGCGEGHQANGHGHETCCADTSGEPLPEAGEAGDGDLSSRH
jgi:divalent metal cation (Fe/Co/Zn/Cd) transporter